MISCILKIATDFISQVSIKQLGSEQAERRTATGWSKSRTELVDDRMD
jgi:hypothetical protein